jgi:hypothetical protein
VRNHSAIRNCALTTGDAFQNSNMVLKLFITLDVHDVGRRQTMLSNQDGFSIFLHVRQQLRSLPLEGRDKFCAHKVILKYHMIKCNTPCRPNVIR